jgi:hypothetical protein
MNNKGQFRLIIGLFIAVIAIVAFIALLPLFTAAIDIGTSYSAGLNCIGSSDYNITVGEKSSIACAGMKLYLPLIVLVVLVAIIGFILYGDRNQQQVPMYQ